MSTQAKNDKMGWPTRGRGSRGNVSSSPSLHRAGDLIEDGFGEEARRRVLLANIMSYCSRRNSLSAGSMSLARDQSVSRR
jgi:hypothetical protein